MLVFKTGDERGNDGSELVKISSAYRRLRLDRRDGKRIVGESVRIDGDILTRIETQSLPKLD